MRRPVQIRHLIFGSLASLQPTALVAAGLWRPPMAVPFRPPAATLSAEVVPGGTLGVTKVQFYSDDTLIGQDDSYPFSLVWSSPPGGGHSLVAVAYDSSGATITSAPVNVIITAPPA